MPKQVKNKAKIQTKNQSKVSKTGLEPLQDRVLIKEDEASKEQKTLGGIIIPATSNEDKSNKKGTVVSVGAGRVEDGKVVPMNVKVGDKVIFQWGDKIKVGEEEFYIVRDGEILAIIR